MNREKGKEKLKNMEPRVKSQRKSLSIKSIPWD